MRILIVNVNTTETMTASIGAQAARAAGPETEIVALTPRFGAESVEGNLESYLAAVGVMDRVLDVRGDLRRRDPGRLRRTRARGPPGVARRAGGGHHRGRRQHRDVPGQKLLRRDHARSGRADDRGPTAARRSGAAMRLGAFEWHRGARVGGRSGSRRRRDRRAGRAGGTRGPRRGGLPGVRRHGRAGGSGPRPDGRAGGRRSSRRRHRRRVPGPARPHHVEGAHVRATPRRSGSAAGP